MKAHINGVTIEGTPQEIAEYQRLQEPKKPFKDIAPESLGESIRRAQYPNGVEAATTRSERRKVYNGPMGIFGQQYHIQQDPVFTMVRTETPIDRALRKEAMKRDEEYVMNGGILGTFDV